MNKTRGLFLDDDELEEDHTGFIYSSDLPVALAYTVLYDEEAAVEVA